MAKLKQLETYASHENYSIIIQYSLRLGIPVAEYINLYIWVGSEEVLQAVSYAYDLEMCTFYMDRDEEINKVEKLLELFYIFIHFIFMCESRFIMILEFVWCSSLFMISLINVNLLFHWRPTFFDQKHLLHLEDKNNRIIWH